VRPLEGIRVVEFLSFTVRPFCGMLFADIGTDVIKMDGPDGDSMRQWPLTKHLHIADV
jgi:crotonobetainyl-CoA:carnitine CoA-transferase CaiB-like acyl-CoA transferase